MAMPIKIPNHFPAKTILEQENIYLIMDERAEHQNIRPLRILILNLMSNKIETETQLLRLLGNTSLQIHIELLQMSTHISKNTSPEHLLKFYQSFEQIRQQRYDGLIITGAPVELLPFEEVDYWSELIDVLQWSNTHVYSTFHICWGAQAGLYHHYNIQKRLLREKMFGIFPHRLVHTNHLLVRGFDERFLVPHSRHTGIDTNEVEAHPDLEILCDSEIAGINLLISKNCRRVFVLGHPEYDQGTLQQEYLRDKHKNNNTKLPYGYFPHDDATQRPPLVWRGHAHLLFENWLNVVYQQTPFDLEALDQ